ncbi:DUF3043 domain-containing protein [Pseudonocardia broussonetiae]|uniref:DUF3043 domain-containing protein n=1 Tax=Pseudonocardia broussonetiae TaxID=2736640 RepID=A0A6M6JNP7_9PSEU|nr:DUF3043 domain-containing protein [Pseudonocardia broussonetiae]QJY48916.1 DUF3043 domain-containing protein [Pseudonocardia broussonetiae]
MTRTGRRPPPRNRRGAHRTTGATPRTRERAAVRLQPADRTGRSTADEHLAVRDRGPVRAYVRDVVDARRRLVGLFMPAFACALISWQSPPSELRSILLTVGLAALAVVVTDAMVLGAQVVRMTRLQFPNTHVSGLRTGWYAFMRAHRPRRMRRPVPRVAP